MTKNGFYFNSISHLCKIVNKQIMKTLSNLIPQPLFNYFEEICQVPRPSKKEEKIRQFLLDFARTNKLEAKTDEIGNVLIFKPATRGMEKAPTVVLQTHMDMVCEKNSDKVFDFDNDTLPSKKFDVVISLYSLDYHYDFNQYTKYLNIIRRAFMYRY